MRSTKMAVLFRLSSLHLPLPRGKRLIITHLLSKKGLVLVLFAVVVLGWVLTQALTGKALSLDSVAAVGSTPLDSTQSKEVVINTTNCKIPNFPAWSPEARSLLPIRCSSYFLGDPKCREQRRHAWSYVNNSHIHINLTAVVESGYSWTSIRCCYHVIRRVTQVLGQHDFTADRTVQYSDNCYPITQTKQHIDAEFIKFQCVSTSVPFFGDVVTREFFANVKPDEVAQAKMKKWTTSLSKKSSSNHVGPPNVIILGVDTMSRLNSIRNFEKSRAVLKSLGAVEMKGHTKVGELTFPNTVAFLSGYNIGQLHNKICYWNKTEPFDNCPFIWKHFSKMNYLTSTMEDGTPMTPWNYEMTGFVNKPVDFYFRPFMLAVMKDLPRVQNTYFRCIGSKQLEQVFLEYIENMLEVGQSSGTPLFVHLWLGSSSHECGTTPKYADWLFAKHILSISKTYENTVIIFMGDHGELFGEFRETVQGWYEDKLPMFWIYLPDGLKKRFPGWVKALKGNSERMTTHFDLYKTFVHILKTFDTENILREEVYDKESEQFGQSLFTEIQENRSCEDAGVVDGYCPCSAPKEIDVGSEKVKMAVMEAIKYIINMIPGEVCETPVLEKIVKAQVIQMFHEYKVYIVSFYTDPGSFLFEATVREIGGKFQVTNDVLRVNKIKNKVTCIKTRTYLTRYCYCK